MALSDEIGIVFAPLVGLHWSLARHSGMTVFHFGKVRPLEGGGTVGQFALHIQCPWRVGTPDRIVTGSSDYWYPADRNLDWTEWEKHRSTRRSSLVPPSLQEKCLLDLFRGYDPDTGACENITDELVVETVSSDNYGGVQIQLSGGYFLQVFPEGTSDFKDAEHWRLFEPGSDADHFVFLASGALERVGARLR
jgi:hypothetical protein